MRELLEGDIAQETQIEQAKPKLKKPRMYQVVLVNDDYTPMDFVVHILKRFFFMPEVKAVAVMLQIHTQGKGHCGIFTRDVAESKVHQVNAYSRMSEFPLLCMMEIV